MLIGDRKLLILQKVSKISDQYFLHIRLLFEEDIEFFWEIDEYTGIELEMITKSHEKYKYRLSFNSIWDSVQECHMGKLTQTYCEESNDAYFPCSKHFINELTAIRNIKDTTDLKDLGFVSTKLILFDEGQYEELQGQNEIELLPKSNLKVRLKSIAALSFIFIMLFSYLSLIYLNETIFSERVLAQSLNSIDSVDINQDEQLIIPSFKLEDTLSYGISKGYVALTFDDGPSKYSTEIMDLLKKYEVGGTFFFTGLNATKYPDHIKYIQSNGYSIGSHSMNHLKLSSISHEQQEFELMQSVELLENITNSEITLFRPAYGSYTNKIRDLIHENQYKMVLWNVDPKDWQNRDADKIFNYIQSSEASGSIILLHESQAVIDALPRIIEYLQELDLEIVNLE